jgi:hypothetical protein
MVADDDLDLDAQTVFREAKRRTKAAEHGQVTAQMLALSRPRSRTARPDVASKRPM